ncbi:MAG: hypothetical protein DWQ10_10590 [Calditrichaeota bacterium]|nr:MAG: hypothetical protein DWQ10_10590 [Calditrichota bacterium]
MAKIMNSQSQARAISAIASLLHVKRQGVATLISRMNDPLPLPSNLEEGDSFVFDNAYRLKLLCWVQKEKMKKLKELDAALDYNLIENELAPRNRRRHWSIDEDLDRKRSENYLG